MKVLHRLISFVRARGEVGNDAWVARVAGLHPEFGLDREFLKPTDSRSPGRKRGHLAFEITEPGYYEFSRFGVYGVASAKLVECGGVKGFVRVDEKGCREVTQEQMFRHFRALERKAQTTEKTAS